MISSIKATKEKKILIVAILVALCGLVSTKGGEKSSNDPNTIGGQVDGKGALFLQSNHTQTKAQLGATATLHCALTSPLADGMVSWVRRRDYHLLTVGRQVYSSDKRMGVKVSSDGSDWMLTIRWVSKTDEGQYECQVSSYPPQSLMLRLQVVQAHAEILGIGERHIHSGSSLRLVCLLREATEPPVYVFWYRDERMINYDTERGVSVDNSREASVLYVASVTRSDEGNYTCVPSNALATSVLVHVIHKENPAGLQENTDSNDNLSSSGVELSASHASHGSPEPPSKPVAPPNDIPRENNNAPVSITTDIILIFAPIFVSKILELHLIVDFTFQLVFRR